MRQEYFLSIKLSPMHCKETLASGNARSILKISYHFLIQLGINMAWKDKHCTFAIEMLFKTCEPVMATGRNFRAHFMLHRIDAVPDEKC